MTPGPEPPSGPPPIDTARQLGVTDEWKEARTVIDNADAQLASLRQYGFTIITGLLAAQGLIEFPIKGATELVPDFVKMGILLATFLLILGLYDLDLRTRLIQRSASDRAARLEGPDGLTNSIKEGYYVNPLLNTSVDLLYYLFILATAILGAAVVASYPFAFTTTYAVEVVTLAVAATLVLAVVRYLRPGDRASMKPRLDRLEASSAGTPRRSRSVAK